MKYTDILLFALIFIVPVARIAIYYRRSKKWKDLACTDPVDEE